MAACSGGDRTSDTYFPALSALRLAALRSTTALNLVPATNLGTLLAGSFSAAPVDGFLSIRAARLANMKVQKPANSSTWLSWLNYSKYFEQVLSKIAHPVHS